MAKKETNKNIDEILKELNSEFGAGSVIKLGDTTPVKVDVIPTGSLSLDMALGVGGLPKGRAVEIYGPEAGGKTTLALSVIANAQKAGDTAAFIDSEYTLNLEYAAKMGVDIKNLLLSQPTTGEEALNIAERLIRSGKVGIVVIDSVAALLPKTEDEANIGDQSMGLKARLMGQALRKLIPIIYKMNSLVIFVNQTRMKLGQRAWGNPETTPGGNALKFHASVRIDIRRVSTIKDEEESVGILVRAKVTKNKVAPPFRQAEFVVLFGSGISEAAEVFNVGLEKGIIEKKGNTYFFDSNKLGVGLKNAINEIKSNKELMENIKDKVLKI